MPAIARQENPRLWIIESEDFRDTPYTYLCDISLGFLPFSLIWRYLYLKIPNICDAPGNRTLNLLV